MTPEAVIFDIGNVLVTWQPENHYDMTYGEERRRALFGSVDLHAMNLAIDAGDEWKATVYDWADRHPEFGPEIRDWHDSWISLAAPLIPRSLRIMRALKRNGVPVFALTNFGRETYAYARTEYAFLNEFDRTYVSGEMKMIKPDAAIYAAVEADCGIAPERLFFTDDRPENIDAAAARGWQTHLFEGPRGLAERLVALGLLTEAEAA